MNYVAHYDRLISRARDRTLVGYRERHHVLPRCMGGTDALANIVELTAEEHYVAHQLLTKIFPSSPRLSTAAVLMAKRCTGNKAYGWLRRLNAEANRGNTYSIGKIRSPEVRAKISAGKLGKSIKPCSDERREKISKALLGREFSLEHRANLSTAKVGNKYRLGKIFSQEARAKISTSLTGKTLSKETREKLSAARKGVPKSLEHRKKISAAQSGKNHWTYRKMMATAVIREQIGA